MIPFERPGEVRPIYPQRNSLQLTWADAAHLYDMFGLQLARTWNGFRPIWIFAAWSAEKFIPETIGYGHTVGSLKY